MAVLAVFVQHLGDTHLGFVRGRIEVSLPGAVVPWVLTVLHHAHWGVDLFFVLSGFSLAQPLLGRLARSGDPGVLAARGWVKEFALRRAARLYPGYLAALGLVVVSVPALRQSEAFAGALAAHLVMAQGYVTPGGLALIGAAWSLTTEVTFYAAWPLLAPRVLAGGVRGVRGARGASPWVIGGAIVVAAWGIRAVLHEVALAEGAPGWMLEASQRRWAVSRIDQFVLGALGAAIFARWRAAGAAGVHMGEGPGSGAAGVHMAGRGRGVHRLRRAAPGMVVAATLLLVPAFYVEGTFHGRRLGGWAYPLVSLVTAGLVLAAAAVPEGAARWMFPRPLRWVGIASYGVFLNHQLALGATAHLAGAAGSWGALGAHAAMALSLSLFLGWASWVAIERPVIEKVAAWRAGGVAGGGPPARGRSPQGHKKERTGAE